MKKLIIIIIAILAVLLVLSFSKNMVAKSAISAGVKAMTGLKLSMRSMNVGIFRTLIDIKGLNLFNPRGFPDKLMVDMPEIYVNYDLGAFLKRKVHLKEVRLDLREFVVVKNKDGKLNLDSLKVVQAEKGEVPAEKKEKAAMPEFQIDVLKLKIGKVVYKDYSQGTPPMVKEYNININEQYTNITDPHSLASLIMVRALMNTAISNLANFDLGPLQANVSETLNQATKAATEAASQFLETGKQLGTGTVESTEEAVEKATESFKKMFEFGE